MTKVRVSQLDPGEALEGQVVTLVDGKWQPADSSGVLSSVGNGLPTVVGRKQGDLHWNKDNSKGYTLVSSDITGASDYFEIPDGPLPYDGTHNFAVATGPVVNERLRLDYHDTFSGSPYGEEIRVPIPSAFVPMLICDFNLVLATEAQRWVSVNVRWGGSRVGQTLIGGQEVGFGFNYGDIPDHHVVQIVSQDTGGGLHVLGMFTVDSLIPDKTMDGVTGLMTATIPCRITSTDEDGGHLKLEVNGTVVFDALCVYPPAGSQITWQSRYHFGPEVSLEDYAFSATTINWEQDYPDDGGGGGGGGSTYIWHEDAVTMIAAGTMNFGIVPGYDEQSIAVFVNGLFQQRDVNWSIGMGFGTSVIVPDLEVGDVVVLRYVEAS